MIASPAIAGKTEFGLPDYFGFFLHLSDFYGRKFVVQASGSQSERKAKNVADRRNTVSKAILRDCPKSAILHLERSRKVTQVL